MLIIPTFEKHVPLDMHLTSLKTGVFGMRARNPAFRSVTARLHALCGGRTGGSDRSLGKMPGVMRAHTAILFSSEHLMCRWVSINHARAPTDSGDFVNLIQIADAAAHT